MVAFLFGNKGSEEYIFGGPSGKTRLTRGKVSTRTVKSEVTTTRPESEHDLSSRPKPEEREPVRRRIRT